MTISQVDAQQELLGTRVDLFTLDSFLDYVAHSVEAGTHGLIAHHNVNSLALLQRSAELRSFYERADAVFVDGMGVVAAARAMGLPLRSRHRLGVLDWIWPFFDRAERAGWHIVHLGGTDQLLAGAQEVIQRQHPDLRLTCRSGYFDARPGSEGNDAVLAWLEAQRPDVLLVGMGMPRQEVWVLQNLARMQGWTVITVGGIFGFLAGVRRPAPRWIGRLGVEWLFRLATEPRRLWRRYLVEPVPLIIPVGAAVIRRIGGGRRRRKAARTGATGSRRVRPPAGQ